MNRYTLEVLVKNQKEMQSEQTTLMEQSNASH